MIKISILNWIKSFRIRTLLLSQSCVLVGTSLAFAKGSFDVMILFLTMLTSGLLQILTNLANDFGDALSGVDSNLREGPSGMVSRGLITPQRMKVAIIIISLLSILSGSILLMSSLHSERELFMFFILGGIAIFAAITYSTGKIPYGHIALGDLSVFIFFGYVGVLGTYYLQTGFYLAELLLPATACGLFATAVLNINNIRDMHSDAVAGKKSLAGLLGFKYSKIYHLFLIGIAVLCLCMFVYEHDASILKWIFVISVPLLIINCMSVYHQNSPDNFDRLIGQTVIATFCTMLLFGIGFIV